MVTGNERLRRVLGFRGRDRLTTHGRERDRRAMFTGTKGVAGRMA
jgi:hypothetical protein